MEDSSFLGQCSGGSPGGDGWLISFLESKERGFNRLIIGAVDPEKIPILFMGFCCGIMEIKKGPPLSRIETR